ncbi:hypothetical protein Pyrde_0417 [Pyrodictium delaneyi]|uniref:Uncharacterized protein n=1 Tax=Pyrodictium delaneyi TaxID=1273541 RepID=A0A0P0N2V1_9CREN|nr:hypothetical protein [Pyrodictium delaneyi]ALL00467.1 hypothetical protein Pyrde_0417 [Pyrodictium delaneyi]OWJ53940.1 hypothetical protein Pdsh_08620 [Pyrodictium delaneyi]
MSQSIVKVLDRYVEKVDYPMLASGELTATHYDDPEGYQRAVGACTVPPGEAREGQEDVLG